VTKKIDKEDIILEALAYYDAFFSHGYKFSDVRREVLRSINTKGARLKEETKDRLEAHLQSLDEDPLERAYKSLKWYLESFITYNSKVVMVMKYSVAEAAEIEKGLLSEAISPNPFSDSYPFLPDPQDAENDKVYPAFYDKKDGVLTIYFGSKRRVSEKIDLLPKDLDQKVQIKYQGVYQVAAYKLEDVMSLDVACIDLSTGKCELRVSNSRGLSGTSIDEAMGILSRKVRKYGGVGRIVEPLNFHPCIMPLYSERQDDSKVTLFHFEADENGVKKEHKPYDKSDLRSEVYHGSGSSAIQYQFRVFAIRKFWVFNEGESEKKLGVQIYGSARLLNDIDPFIAQAKVLDVFTKRDYDFVMGKVLPFTV
jgi:hypothetical protein